MSRITMLTGGGGIIGRAMVAELASDDHHVVVADRNGAAASEAVASVADGTATALECDITDRDALESARLTIERDIGPVTGLICNAATKSDNFFEPFERFPIDDWNEVMATNLTGPAICAQVFGSQMAERGTGAIVNVLSIYGIVAPDQRIYAGSEYEGRAINTPAIYSASKAGLWGLTKYLASYWGSSGVRVNALTPGGVFSGQNDTFVQAYSERTMLGRMAHSDEIAAAAGFLLSDRAGYITGQNLVVDGGWTAW